MSTLLPFGLELPTAPSPRPDTHSEPPVSAGDPFELEMNRALKVCSNKENVAQTSRRPPGRKTLPQSPNDCERVPDQPPATHAFKPAYKRSDMATTDLTDDVPQPGSRRNVSERTTIVDPSTLQGLAAILPTPTSQAQCATNATAAARTSNIMKIPTDPPTAGQSERADSPEVNRSQPGKVEQKTPAILSSTLQKPDSNVVPELASPQADGLCAGTAGNKPVTPSSDSEKNNEASAIDLKGAEPADKPKFEAGMLALPNALGPPLKDTLEHDPNGVTPSDNVAADPPNGPPIPLPGKDFPATLGTSAAQQEMSMKKAEKALKFAAQPEQNLPGNSVVSADQSGQQSVALQSTSTNPVATSDPLATDSRLVSLEKTHDLVAMHALRLGPSGHDTMRVVIEPGSGTRLSLELRFANGGIEAQAQLHRGDYEFLNHHWSELQARLEPRGIHLGVLGCSTGSAGDQRQPAHQPANFEQDEQPPHSAIAEFALDGSLKNARKTKVNSKSYNGWETWA